MAGQVRGSILSKTLIHGVCKFPQCFSVCHIGNIVSSVNCGFQDANYASATRQRILTNPIMRAVAKVLRARAREHSSNFCEQFQFLFNNLIHF